ncbi:hypothetical protein HN873_006592 [Arachis hypogaea]|nr:uncharacterized protein DS421_3g63820 [Arachis hypogaea]
MHYFVLACTQKGNHQSLKQSPTEYQCGAKITVSLKEDRLWYIMKAVLEHSHELLPTKSMMFKVNKNVSVHVKRTMETNHETRMNKFFRSLVHDSEENGSLSFVEQELRNHVKKEGF